MLSGIKDLDLEPTTKDKLLYVAVALPLLIALGTVLRVVGGLSESVALMIVLPLQVTSFVAWHLGRAIARARKDAAVRPMRNNWHFRRAQSSPSR
jgi:hypothetical protein